MVIQKRNLVLNLLQGWGQQCSATGLFRAVIFGEGVLALEDNSLGLLSGDLSVE